MLWEPRLGVGRTGVLSSRRESSCLVCCYCGHYHLCPRALRRERALGPRGVLLSLFIIVSQPHTHTHTHRSCGGEKPVLREMRLVLQRAGDRRDGWARMTEDAAR